LSRGLSPVKGTANKADNNNIARSNIHIANQPFGMRLYIFRSNVRNFISTENANEAHLSADDRANCKSRLNQLFHRFTTPWELTAGTSAICNVEGGVNVSIFMMNSAHGKASN
jgi:hypothetical protein